MKLTILASLTCSLFLLAACEDRTPQVIEKPVAETSNLETSRLGSAVDDYIQSPTAEQAADVDRALADLNGEIAELDQQVTTSTGDERAEALRKADNLRAYRDREQLRYTEAKARATGETVEDSARDAGDAVKDAAQSAGEGIKDAAESVKDGVGDAVDSVRESMD